jgi:type VI secretion system secreted protein Hcp
MWKDFEFNSAYDKNGLFEVDDYGFTVEQTLNIGSQGGGSGAGKVTFQDFTINRSVDKSSPHLFTHTCAGKPFKDVRLGLRKSAGGDMSGIIFVVFCFKLAAIKSIGWSHSDESPKEALTISYGGLQIFYRPQNPDGTLSDEIAGGWNGVRNIRDDIKNSDIIGAKVTKGA